MTTGEIAAWLMDSDPALRWQVERDLLDEPASVWQHTRAGIASSGFGAALLARQDDDGQWDGGAFFPARHDPERDHSDGGQPWTATTWTLNTLREWGLDPSVLQRRRTAELLGRHSVWEYDGSPYWSGEVDCCINAWTLANGVWLGADISGLVEWFLEHQLADGGWNCEWVDGSRRSSFHSTLNSLKGLLSWEISTAGSAEVRAARHRGQEYLLRRGLVRRLSTGAVVGPWVYDFAYPIRWSYSALNACEYFRLATAHDHIAADPRMAPAVEIVRSGRRDDGTWLQTGRQPGAVWFEVDVAAGEPSKWLTLYGSRVLRWWDTAS